MYGRIFVEEKRNSIKGFFHPNLSCDREESLLRELYEKYRGTLLFLFESRGSSGLLCTTVLSKTKDLRPDRIEK